MSSVWIKICGMTTPEAVEACLAAEKLARTPPYVAGVAIPVSSLSLLLNASDPKH